MNERTKRDSQVVVRAAIEIHFVADIESQANRPEAPLESAAWVEDTTHIFGAQILYRTGKRIEGRGSRVKTRIEDASFYRNKCPNRVMPHFELWSK